MTRIGPPGPSLGDGVVVLNDHVLSAVIGLPATSATPPAPPFSVTV